MFDAYRKIQPEIDKAKKFVKDHPTLVACVATAAVSWKVSHDITLKAVLEDTTALSYQWGWEHGALVEVNQIFLSFIDRRGLMDEFETYLDQLK